MNRREFVKAVGGLIGMAALPIPAGAASSVFGLEGYGFTETIVWEPQFKAWLITLLHEESGLDYGRLMEDDPREMPEAILDFYRDDALYALALKKKNDALPATAA